MMPVAVPRANVAFIASMRERLGNAVLNRLAPSPASPPCAANPVLMRVSTSPMP
jgi:hypothetical protein